MKKQRRQQFDGGGIHLENLSQHPRLHHPAHTVPTEAQPQSSTALDLEAVDTRGQVNRRVSHHSHGGQNPRRSHRRGSSSWSVRSWDSHAHYQDFRDEDEEDEDEADSSQPDGLFPSNRASKIVCYCDMSTFKTPRTILRVLLVVSHFDFLRFSTQFCIRFREHCRTEIPRF